MINLRLFFIASLMLMPLGVSAKEMLYVMLNNDHPILGLDDLPPVGLDVQYLIVDAYEAVLREAQDELAVVQERGPQWILDNLGQVELFADNIIMNYEADIMAAFQDKISVAAISQKYNIQTLPAILLVNESGMFKLIVNELNVARAFEIFEGMPYEAL